jgi:hypothetical protein
VDSSARGNFVKSGGLAENVRVTQLSKRPSQSYLMSDKHLSQPERYQIYALTKAEHLPVEEF